MNATEAHRKPVNRSFPPSSAYDNFDPSLLFPKQKEVVAAVLRELTEDQQGFSILKMGQRSGKNIIAAMVAKHGPFNKAFIFDLHHGGMASDFSIPTYWCSKVFPRTLVEGDEERPLIILNEAFWLDDSYDIFNEARNYAPTLVVGSNGPQFREDKRWQLLKGHSYATWEINPNYPTREALIASMGDSEQDMQKFERDYGAF
jgi:hypothetical protein